MPSDPTVFDELKLPFIYVPDGAPEPTEWMQSHPDYIKLPATFEPRSDSDGRAGRSSSGVWRTIDGLSAASDPVAPRPATESDMSNAMPDARCDTTSSEPYRYSGGVSIPADPIAAFRRANDALATAASDYASGPVGGLNMHAHAQNDSPI